MLEFQDYQIFPLRSSSTNAPTLYVFAVAPSCLLALPSAVSPEIL
ncbi:hypothetical protein [Bacteroides ovatus]